MYALVVAHASRQIEGSRALRVACDEDARRVSLAKRHTLTSHTQHGLLRAARTPSHPPRGTPMAAAATSARARHAPRPPAARARAVAAPLAWRARI